MQFDRLTTEQANLDSQLLDTLPPLQAAQLMNRIDRDAALAVEQALPAIAEAVTRIAARMKTGGRLVYMGAGTSGRLGVLDASECPPTFGVDANIVVGIIAGGDRALRHASESAEDKPELGQQGLEAIALHAGDCVVAISASGYAPYCIGGLDYARALGALTIAMSCNRDAAISRHADIAIEMPTGPEILSGSTRLKAGTATKMALNMLSTLTMVQLGKVYGNLMVDMRPTNTKLKDRAIRMVMKALDLPRDAAEALYQASGDNVKAAIVMHKTGVPAQAAHKALHEAGGFVRQALEALRR